jgi:polyferredoxin
VAKSKTPKQSGEKWEWLAHGFERVTMILRAGIIGRLAVLGVASLAFLVAVLWLLPESLRTTDFAVLIVSLGIGVVLIVVFGSLWYANKYPQTALMEGAQINAWKKLEVLTKSGSVSAELQEPSADASMPMIDVSGQAMLPDAPGNSTPALPEGDARG